jgi:hypothetical protein
VNGIAILREFFSGGQIAAQRHPVAAGRDWLPMRRIAH